MKVRVFSQSYGQRIWFRCPACASGHVVEARHDGGHPSWTFNGDVDRPTISPSLLCRTWDAWTRIPEDRWLVYDRRDEGLTCRVPKDWVGDDCEPTVAAVASRLGVAPTEQAVRDEVDRRIEQLPPSVCHLFLRNGEVEFLGDCTHGYAGRTVELPDLPPEGQPVS